MDRPKTPKELRKFIGMVNYYRDMWPSRAHILKPLTDHAGLKKGQPLIWTDEMQATFEKMKMLCTADVLAVYPDHNKRFDIYTDASDYQLGAVICQDGRPVAYFSRKLNKDKTRPRISVETSVSSREGQIWNHSIPIHRVYVRNRATYTYVKGVSRVFPPNFAEILAILCNIIDETRVETGINLVSVSDPLRPRLSQSRKIS
jgi:hypothetical protein